MMTLFTELLSFFVICLMLKQQIDGLSTAAADLKVNGVTFRWMTTYTKEVEDRVLYMERDLFNPNHLLLSDGCALKTLDMSQYGAYTLNRARRSPQTIVGSSRNCNYKEGTGTEAKFQLITSFEQLNRSTVILTDHQNHCIRVVHRNLNLTQTYAGKCTEDGELNGPFTQARFYKPDELAKAPNPAIMYICDGKSIRKINTLSQTVTPFISVSYTPIALTIGPQWKHIYASTKTRVFKINLLTKLVSYLSASVSPGFSDGPLHLARFNSFLNFIFVNPRTILGVDSGNNRLRVLNIAENSNNTASSICNGALVSRDGDAKLCQLSTPFSALMIEEQGSIFIGGTREIRRLTVSGDLKGPLPRPSQTRPPQTTQPTSAATAKPSTYPERTTTDVPAPANKATIISIVSVVAVLTAAAIGVVVCMCVRRKACKAHCCAGTELYDGQNSTSKRYEQQHTHGSLKSVDSDYHVYERPLDTQYNNLDGYTRPLPTRPRAPVPIPAAYGEYVVTSSSPSRVSISSGVYSYIDIPGERGEAREEEEDKEGYVDNPTLAYVSFEPYVVTS